MLVLPLRLFVFFLGGGRFPGVLVADGYGLELVEPELAAMLGGSKYVVGEVGDSGGN